MAGSDYVVTDARIGTDGASSITWQEICGDPTIDWDTAVKAIIAVFCNSSAHTPDAEAFKLRWRNLTDNPSGSFVDLTDTGELQRGASGGAITNADPVGDGAGCETPIDDSEEVENESPLLSASLVATQNDYIETQWCVDFSSALAGKEYQFELYSNTAGASCGTVTPTITVVAAIVTLVGSLAAQSDLTDILMSADKKVLPEDITGQSNTPNALMKNTMKILPEDIVGLSNIPDALMKVAMDLVGDLDGLAALTDLLLSVDTSLSPEDITALSSTAAINIEMTIKLLPEDIDGLSSLGNVPLVIPSMKLFGTIDGVGDLTDILMKLAMDLTGSLDGAADLNGAITFSISLIGSLDAVSNLPDVLMETTMKAFGTIDGALSLSGVIKFDVSKLFGTVDGVADLTNILMKATMNLIGDLDGLSGADGVLGKFILLIGSTDGLATIENNLLSADMKLTGNIPALANVPAALLTTTMKIIGDIDGLAGLAGVLKRVYNFTGTSGGTTTLAAALSATMKMIGVSDGISALTGTTKLTRSLIGDIGATSDLATILLKRERKLIPATILGQSLLQGVLFVGLLIEILEPWTVTLDDANIYATVSDDMPWTVEMSDERIYVEDIT